MQNVQIGHTAGRGEGEIVGKDSLSVETIAPM